jgi:hypothetical protein
LSPLSTVSWASKFSPHQMNRLNASFRTRLQKRNAHLRLTLNLRASGVSGEVRPTVAVCDSNLKDNVVIDVKIKRIAHENFHIHKTNWLMKLV